MDACIPSGTEPDDPWAEAAGADDCIPSGEPDDPWAEAAHDAGADDCIPSGEPDPAAHDAGADPSSLAWKPDPAHYDAGADPAISSRPSKRARLQAELLKEALADAAQNALAVAPVAQNALAVAPVAQIAEVPSAAQNLAVVARRAAPAALPQVPKEKLKLLQHSNSSSDPWPVAAAFQQFVEHTMPLEPADEDANDQFSKMSSFYLAGRSSRIMSQSATSQALGVDPRLLQQHLRRLANTALHMDVSAKAIVERVAGTALSDDDLVAYVDYARYDETPLPVGTSARAQPPSRAASSTESRVVQQTPLPKLASACRTTTAPNKILQSESRFGFIVRVGGLLRIVIGGTASFLQHLERTTAECLAEATRRRGHLNDFAHRFPFKSRITTVDGYLANDRAERQTVRERPEGWSRLPLLCDVHRIAGAHKYTFDLVPETIRGQIAFALSLNEGAALEVFRKHLREQIAKRFVLLRGTPPAECAAYRQHLVRLCLSQGPRLLNRRMSLIMLPNGDWTRRDRVEVWVPAHIDGVDEAQVLAAVTRSLEDVLCSSRFTIYPRHRWTNGDVAFSEFCLLEGIHGLASATYPAFSLEVGSRKQKAPAADVDGGGPADVDEAAPAVDDDPVPPADLVEWNAAANPDVGPEIDDLVRDNQARAREENDQRRKHASLWLASRPLAKALITRQCMEPLARLLRGQLAMSGQDWLEADRRSCAKASIAARESDRRYPILEAARGTLEGKFSKQNFLLLSQSCLWQGIIPTLDRNMTTRSLCFRLLSTAGCSVARALAQPHSQYPYRLFRLLDSVAHADAILQDPPCLLDPWSTAFVDPHRAEPEGLRGDVPRAKATLVAELAMVDIAQLEAGHASIRRRLFSRGVQTHGLVLQDLSAERLLDRVRHDGQQWGTSLHERRPSRSAGQPLDGADGDDGKAHRNPGPWKAFVRQQSLNTKGGLPDSSKLSRQYALLDGAAKQALREVGDDAKRSRGAGNKGASSFGLTSRELERVQLRRRKEAAIALAGSADASDDPSTTHIARIQAAIGRAASLPGHRSVMDMAAEARASVSHAAQHDRQQLQASCQEFKEWQSTTGKALVSGFVSIHPNMSPVAAIFEGVPSTSAAAVMMRHPTALTAAVCKSVADASRKSNIAQSLSLDWQAKHACIFHSQCPPIEEQRLPPRRRPPCSEIGFCCCGPFGDRLEALRNQFYNLLKSTFAKKLPTWNLFFLKYIVVRLRVVREVADDPWAEAAAEADGLAGGGAVDKYTYWHIGAHSLKPVASTFRDLAFVKERMHGGRVEIDLTVIRAKIT